MIKSKNCYDAFKADSVKLCISFFRPRLSKIVIGNTIERVRDPPLKFADLKNNDDLASINEDLFLNDAQASNKERRIDNESPASIQVSNCFNVMKAYTVYLEDRNGSWNCSNVSYFQGSKIDNKNIINHYSNQTGRKFTVLQSRLNLSTHITGDNSDYI